MAAEGPASEAQSTGPESAAPTLAAPPLAAPRANARLTRHARRHQLIAAAMPVAARGGLADLALDAVSARAGVTRNLLYHYFPRGRLDLLIAVVSEAERQLGLADPDLAEPGQADPLPRMLEHALAPTHAWRIHRWAVASSDPEIRELAARTVDGIVLSLSLTHLTTRDPDPLVLAALRGYVAFAETALDGGRTAGLARPALARLLSDALSAILAAARR